jgi:hypothetical protein
VPRARHLGSFWGAFGELFWDQIGQRGAQMGPRGPSRSAKYRKHAFAKRFKNQWFLRLLGVRGRPRQLLKTKNAPERLSWATQGHLEPSWGHVGSKSFQVSSGSLGLCPGLAVLGPFGVHLGTHFGTRSAQEEPRWAQEDHREVLKTENVHLHKP